MEIYILRAKEDKDGIAIYFERMGHLLYHKIVFDILKDNLNCEAMSYTDLITDIDSKLRWNGIEFEFNHHYMLGNFILTVPEHADALEQLANQVVDFIKDKVKQANPDMQD